MRRVGLLLFVVCMSAMSLFAGKLPRGVGKARSAVASVVTYRQGVMLHSGTAVFAASNNDLIASYTLFVGDACPLRFKEQRNRGIAACCDDSLGLELADQLTACLTARRKCLYGLDELS